MITHQPDLTPVPDKNNFCLEENYWYIYKNTARYVPSEFTYNGASIPVFAQIFTYTPFHPKIMAAALIHDWLYTSGEVSRLMADQIFKAVLLECGVPKYKANMMYAGVRLGGASHYKKEL